MLSCCNISDNTNSFRNRIIQQRSMDGADYLYEYVSCIIYDPISPFSITDKYLIDENDKPDN